MQHAPEPLPALVGEALSCHLTAAAIPEGQTIWRLATTGASIDDPVRQTLYRQAIAELRQMQADEH